MSHEDGSIDRRLLLGAAGLAGFAALSRIAHAGPVNPPVGPVGPTGRTTDEIYNKIAPNGSGDGRIAIPGGTTQVAIFNPGSYVLTGNIAVGSPQQSAIVIAASNVTVDLNGYTLSGQSNVPNGLTINSAGIGVVVRNGIISGFGIGVGLLSGTSRVLLEDLLIRDARTVGISGTDGPTLRSICVRRCTIQDTGSSTVASEASQTIAGILLAGGHHKIEECTIQRLVYNGTGPGVPTFRGIGLTSGSPTGLGHVVARNSVTNDVALTGTATGIAFSGGGTYRDNTVINFATKYPLGGGAPVDGGGNV